MILMAKKSVWIQTPYFIPDESVQEALSIAAMSGVDVRVMIPCKPDHPVVYRATEYYSSQLLEIRCEDLRISKRIPSCQNNGR